MYVYGHLVQQLEEELALVKAKYYGVFPLLCSRSLDRLPYV